MQNAHHLNGDRIRPRALTVEERIQELVDARRSRRRAGPSSTFPRTCLSLDPDEDSTVYASSTSSGGDNGQNPQDERQHDERYPHLGSDGDRWGYVDDELLYEDGYDTEDQDDEMEIDTQVYAHFPHKWKRKRSTLIEPLIHSFVFNPLFSYIQERSPEPRRQISTSPVFRSPPSSPSSSHLVSSSSPPAALHQTTFTGPQHSEDQMVEAIAFRLFNLQFNVSISTLEAIFHFAHAHTHRDGVQLNPATLFGGPSGRGCTKHTIDAFFDKCAPLNRITLTVCKNGCSILDKNTHSCHSCGTSARSGQPFAMYDPRLLIST